MERERIAADRLKQAEHALRLADQAPSEATRTAWRQLAAAWLHLARRSFEAPPEGAPPHSFIPASPEVRQDIR